MADEQLTLLPEERLELLSSYVEVEKLAHEDVQPASRELIESVRAFGILQPILVRCNEDEYSVVDGRRRLDAARRVGLSDLPAMVAFTDLSVADVMTIAANTTRRPNPIAEFDAIDRLARRGATEKDIAGATGMSRQTIKARMGLLHLSPELTGAFRAGKISPSVAEGASKLPQSLQDILAATLLVKGRITEADVHEVRTARSQQAAAQLPDAMFELPSVHVHEIHLAPEPIEAGLARELQSIIERMPKVQGVLLRSLEWVAEMLMDIATGKVAVVEEDGPLSPSDMAVMYPADHLGVDWYGEDPEESSIAQANSSLDAEAIEREEIDERAGHGTWDDGPFADKKSDAEAYFDEIGRT